MNNMLKMGVLTLGLGLALHSTDANAVLATYTTRSNAVNYCQAFTPGVSNTIRNRVIGSENIGPPIALACNYMSDLNGAAGNTLLTEVTLFFTNNSNASATVSCTMLTGPSANITGTGVVYASNKSATIGPGGAAALLWNAADNPTPGAVDLGNTLVGVNCTMPTNMILSINRLRWTADNGVGS